MRLTLNEYIPVIDYFCTRFNPLMRRMISNLCTGSVVARKERYLIPRNVLVLTRAWWALPIGVRGKLYAFNFALLNIVKIIAPFLGVVIIAYRDVIPAMKLGACPPILFLNKSYGFTTLFY